MANSPVMTSINLRLNVGIGRNQIQQQQNMYQPLYLTDDIIRNENFQLDTDGEFETPSNEVIKNLVISVNAPVLVEMVVKDLDNAGAFITSKFTVRKLAVFDFDIEKIKIKAVEVTRVYLNSVSSINP